MRWAGLEALPQLNRGDVVVAPNLSRVPIVRPGIAFDVLMHRHRRPCAQIAL